ncbi:MAG: hypothetical protein RL662_1006 [Bacteroidota bacterium]
MIKHISFDLWLTLIKSHPQFKQKRAELIAQTFGIKHIEPAAIEQFIRSVDKVIDRYNMISGKKLAANNMYCRILQSVVPNSRTVSIDDAIALRQQSDKLFMQYPPLFVNDNIPQLLTQLKSEGYSINLSSNTGFIEGQILRTTLSNLGIGSYFDFLVFSDEINASKPSSLFFEHVHQQTSCSKSEILHIGDNPQADYQGAINFGFNALLITNSKYTIDVIRPKL